MKNIFFFLFLWISIIGFGQDNPNKLYSGFMVGQGNIQSEFYFNHLNFLGVNGNTSSIVGRYGMSNTVELGARISHQSYKVSDQKIKGTLPVGIGSKIFIYSSPKSLITSNQSILLPISSGNFDTDEVGFHLDIILNHQFNDIFSLEFDVGWLHQFSTNTPYNTSKINIAVTDYLDFYNQVDLIFKDNEYSYWYRVGSELWLTEDIKLIVDYGIALDSDYKNRVSLGFLTRWLD